MLALITRPLPDAERTASQLKNIGIDSFIEPLLKISYMSEIEEKIYAAINQNAQAIIITSSNGIRALENFSSKDFPIITIGQTTTKMAFEAGFSNITNAGSNVEELIRFIINNYSASNGAFVYACAKITAGNLSEILSGNGFNIVNIITYDASPAKKLSDDCAKLIKTSAFNMVLLYSPRTSDIFSSLLKENGLENYMANAHVFCLSFNVAAPFNAIGFKNIHLAKSPDNDSLLELISNFRFTDN